MKELFDVHCHMVPGVDDGATDLEESLAMLKMQHEDGVRKIIITPHYRQRMFETPAKKVHEQFLKLQEAAKKEYPDMSLYLGCELHSNMDLQDILEKRKYVTMAGSSYVLLEFSEGDSAQHIRERVYNVLSCGYEPIIAHVERYQATVKSVGFSSDLVDMGARLQVNVESILGKYTWGAKRYCRKLMKEDLLGFVGSDSHNTKTRIPNIGAGAAYVSPFLGRLDDISVAGINLVKDIVQIFKAGDIHTEIIAASIRNPIHVTDCAMAGADIATVPYSVLEAMTKHPLTDAGIEKFVKDYQAVFHD